MTADDTRPSLLARLQDAADGSAWQQFHSVHRDLVLQYCRRRGLQPADAEDVLQVVLLRLSQSLPGFRYDPDRGRFRNYLARVVANALNDHFAARVRHPARLATEAADGVADDDRATEAAWLEEWRRSHFRSAFEHVRRHHAERTVAIFEALIAGATPDEVAARFGTTPAAVHKVKQRLRDELSARITAQVEAEDRGGAHA